MRWLWTGLVVGAAIGAVPSGGCVSAKMAPEVMTYNKAIARAENEMLLLNIVRAAKYSPMYLVDLSKITGSLKGEMSGKVGYQLIGDASSGASANSLASVTGTYSVNPTFDVNVLTTRDFIRGFRQPVATEELSSLLSQGWRRELLLHLFVARVMVGSGHKELVNRLQVQGSGSGLTEDGSERFREFSQWVTGFCACRPHVVTCPTSRKPIGPPVSEREAQDLGTLVKIGKEGLGLAKVKEAGEADRYQLLGKEEPGASKLVPEKQKEVCAGDSGAEMPAPGEAAAGLLKGTDCAGIEVEFELRSPDAVLRYLGDIVRWESSSRKIPQVVLCLEPKDARCVRFEALPLFLAIQMTGLDAERERRWRNRRAAVLVTDDAGDRYMIPEQPWPLRQGSRATTTVGDVKEAFKDDWWAEEKCAGPGLSPDVLAIVSQLISLHKSAKDLGLTPVVRTVGP